MLQQPLRLGGLALVCALATSALVLVTFLASNLVLSVLGGLGGLESAAPDAPDATDTTDTTEPPASAVLVSTEPDQEPRQLGGCRERGPDRDADRCGRQQAGAERARP